MTVQDAIESAMRKLGVLASGESATPSELNDSMGTLQTMLRMWASQKILVHATTKESFNLVAGQASYTWGTDGNINTTRPHSVFGAFVRDASGYDHPVEIVSEGRYNAIAQKSVQERPSRIFYHPLYPLGYLYAYPTPDAAEAMWVDSLKPFTETSSFDALTSTLAFPPNYEEPIVYNLAVRIAPDFGKSISVEIAAIASDGYDNLVTLNSGNQVEPINLTLPIGGSSAYSINNG